MGRVLLIISMFFKWIGGQDIDEATFFRSISLAALEKAKDRHMGVGIEVVHFLPTMFKHGQ